MNEHIVDEWVESSRMQERHDFFRRYPLDDRLYRLFSVACCRETWNELTDERSKKAVETAELYADGLTTKRELHEACDDAWKVYFSVDAFDRGIASAASAVYTVYTSAVYAASTSAAHAADAAVYTAHDVSDFYLQKRQGIILAQMYPITFSDNWITPTTTSLAQQIYDKKDFSLMPILADALQDVDCNEEILNHLRGNGPFYKGNYIIDKLIGKRS